MKNLTHSIASKAHKTPSPRYAIVIRSFRLMVIVLWTVSKKIYKGDEKMFEYLTANVIRDLMVIIGLGLTGSVASQIRYKIRRGGK